MTEITKPNSKEILIDYLNTHGIKQKYVAKKLGISETSLSYHLSKKSKFTVDFAFAVSKALDISPAVFLRENYKKLVTK